MFDADACPYQKSCMVLCGMLYAIKGGTMENPA